MKNKKSTYLLGLLVLVVWGMIFYRFFNAIGDNPGSITSPSVKIKEPYDDYTIPKDTIRLPSGYRDPFGLTKAKDTTRVISPKNPKMNIQVTAIPAINWGEIRYLGYIRNPGSRKLIAIMHIHGVEVMMSEGESAENVRLLRNLRDSIQVNYRGRTKYITIKPATL